MIQVQGRRLSCSRHFLSSLLPEVQNDCLSNEPFTQDSMLQQPHLIIRPVTAPPPTFNGFCSHTDLFWTAPEFLRDLVSSRKGTYKGDVYSFSIILQEVVVRGPPYCMLGLSAEGTSPSDCGEVECFCFYITSSDFKPDSHVPPEIIRKVRKPPPMCRPTVAPDQAPLECIQLIKQCWSELPERRPTFDEIFDRVRSDLTSTPE